MREIVLDTETTGLDPATGDRIVEIGALELFNHLPTGIRFHQYINPKRNMPAEAFAVHGLSEEFLADKPVFADIAEEFQEFVKNDTLIIHNASFDMKFLNAELKIVNRPALKFDRVIDTLMLARKKHPAGPNSLDALCRRYKIDNSMRDIHGALLDSELLAGVYLELIGGRQTSLTLSVQEKKIETVKIVETRIERTRPTPLPSRLSKQEELAHKTLIHTFGGQTIWSEFIDLTDKEPREK